MKRTPALTFILASLLLAQTAHAQPTEGPHSDGPPGRERARTFLVLRLVDALNLNDQEALKVGSIVRQSDERRQQLMKQRQTLADQLRAALANKPPDPAALGKLVSDGNDLDQKLALIPEDTFHEMQKVLTVEQQAKLILFRRELQGEIRRAIQGRRFGGGRRSRQANGPIEEP
jgi:Spy/CpxP family protein refolding chaperone